MIRKNLFKDSVEQQGKTLDDIANLLGICKQSLYFRLNGKVVFTLVEVNEIRKYLNMDISLFKEIFLQD